MTAVPGTSRQVTPSQMQPFREGGGVGKLESNMTTTVPLSRLPAGLRFLSQCRTLMGMMVLILYVTTT